MWLANLGWQMSPWGQMQAVATTFIDIYIVEREKKDQHKWTKMMDPSRNNSMNQNCHAQNSHCRGHRILVLVYRLYILSDIYATKKCPNRRAVMEEGLACFLSDGYALSYIFLKYIMYVCGIHHQWFDYSAESRLIPQAEKTTIQWALMQSILVSHFIKISSCWIFLNSYFSNFINFFRYFFIHFTLLFI